MKQKIVIKVQMANDKCRSKALALVAATRGVDSVALAGERKDKVVVVGNGVDPVQLTSALRKKVGPAQLVQVGEEKAVVVDYYYQYAPQPAVGVNAVVHYPSQPVGVNAVNEHPATAYGYQQFGEPKIVCILGFAGVGKTTLADLLYHAIGEQFQCRAFVSVSPSPNMMEILIAILTEVTNEPYGGATEGAAEQSLIHSISNFLADKRYLVIIDDIWHWEECEIVRKSLPKNNLGSRIIMTTRINALAEKCRTTNGAIVYEIKGLTAYAAEALSKRILSGSPLAHTTAQTIAHTIDYGFPSAVICMSLALEEQLQRHSMSTAVRRVRDGFLNIPRLQPLLESLCLGYHDLPLHLKACLLHCSICPDYYTFERDSLVSKWIAEGFVHEEEAAEGCFDELVNRRLIELERESEYDIHTSLEKKYKIHTIMLGFLRCKSQEDNFVTCLGHETDISSLHTTRRIRRLSLQYQPDPVDFSRMDLSHARSLYVFDAASAVPFKRFERLRVLDLEYAEDLENAHLVYICELLWLRYLGLKGTPISELPPQIGRLQHLETLDVRGTKVSELPPQIGRLLHLKVSELPRQIGRLLHLKTLVVSGTKVSELPPEIGTLQHLERLDVRNTMVSELPWEAGQISKSVRVLAGDEDSRQGVKLPEGICQDLMNDIPESSLEECREVLSIVVFDRFGLGTVPPLVGVFKVPNRRMCIPQLIKKHFRILSSLDIRLCKLDTDDLKFLREMPNLQTLVVRFEVLPREPIAISGEGFAMLESFCVDSRMPRVTFGQGAMPNLKRLVFKLYAGPAGEDHVGITHLRSLEKVVFRCSPWYKSDSPGISKTVAVVRREAGEHPNRITLCINDDEEEIFPEKDSAQICQENRGAGSRSGTEADKFDDDRNSHAGNDNTKETFQAENFASCSQTSEIEEIEAQEYSCSHSSKGGLQEQQRFHQNQKQFQPQIQHHLQGNWQDNTQMLKKNQPSQSQENVQRQGHFGGQQGRPGGQLQQVLGCNQSPSQLGFDGAIQELSAATLEKEEGQEVLLMGTRAIEKVATEVFGARSSWTPWTSRIAPGSG